MLCERCHQREANVSYTQTINGVTEEINLCSECAAETGILNAGIEAFDFPNYIGQTAFNFPFETQSFFPEQQLRQKTAHMQCSECGQTLADFKRTGLFGCPHCYEDFRAFIEPMLDEIQSTHVHVEQDQISAQDTEKTDSEEGNSNQNKDVSNDKAESESQNPEIIKLKKELQELIKQEKYEEAAKVRDQIRDLEQKDK